MNTMSLVQCLFIVSAYMSVPACAFSTPSTIPQTSTATSTTTSTSLFAAESSGRSSRRDVLQNIVSFGVASATSMVALGGYPTDATADAARPMYLTEPTDEFKANEAKALEFKRQQLAVKKEFTGALDKFLAEPNDEDAIVADLKTLKALIAKNGGLPLGIKKDELYKIIRSKKAKGFWPTNCEIAYQSLQGEISYQQNPNLEKDIGNPYQ